MGHAGQRRGRNQASVKFQAKMHGGEFTLIPLRNEGVTCMSQSLSHLALRDPNFHTSSSVSQIVPLSPGKVGKKGRAVGLASALPVPCFSSCARGAVPGPPGSLQWSWLG